MLKLASLLVVVASLLGADRKVADPKPASIFTDHMVLQRDIAAPVWGTAEPGEEVTVAIDGQKKSAKAGADGSWRVTLDPLKAGGPHELSIGALTLKDVLVGEVWVCSGQSNMEWSVNASLNAAEEKGNANYPKIRLVTVPKKPADVPQRDFAGSWKACSPETVGGFSAVGYFFGRDLHKALEIPIGLIHTSWGGTPAEAWTKKEVLEANPETKGLAEAHTARAAAHAKALEAHKAAVEKAKAEGNPPPAPLRGPGPGPTTLYNGMIAPLVSYAIRGAIWYQGESNASRAKQYRTLFPDMIKNWRADWGQGDFPFLFVQLANFMARKDQPAESSWAELREAQTMTLGLPRTGMAVIIDIGDAKDIHPKNKQDVGKRLALAARHVAHGEQLVYSGPVYDSMKVEGDRAVISFKHVGGGLVAKGEKLVGFSVAGEDRKFAWADAKVEGDKVVVSSPQVAKPVAVRYAWADNPECTLYNKEGLPASPFRTDGPERPQN